MIIGGLDIGTTGCKLTAFDENGAYLGKAYRNYPSERGTSQTIDAEKILEAVLEVIAEIGGRYPDLSGIGVTSFGETFVMTDESGCPLMPSMLYTDPRGKRECMELTDKLGSRHIQEICGARSSETYSLPKIMWVKKHHPDIYARAKHIFLIQDFIVWSLTHVAQIDYSLAARTMAFDIRNLTWSREILEVAGIDPSLLSKPVPTGTPAGHLTSEIAQKTGVSESIQVISVSHDQIAAAVGSGVFSGNVAVDGAGTVECLTPVFNSLPKMDLMYENNYAVIPYVIPGTYTCYAYETMGGALLQWCVDTLAKKEKELAMKQGISPNVYLENLYKAEGNGHEPGELLVLPHFAGAATPYMDSGSKGAILGLTAATSVADIYHACMEGIVCEMMLNMEKLNLSGISFEYLRATGGGARSEVWMQMKADMLNVTITALETSDAGTVGCAMMAGLALHCFRNLEDAASHMVVCKKTYTPDPVSHEKYMKVYERYRKLYEAVRPLV